MAAQANFASVRADPYVPLWLALWSKHGSDAHVVTGQLVPVLEAVLAASGRRMRPPHTVDTLAVTITALNQGLALRVAIQPDRVPVQQADDDGSWDLFATTVMTLFEAITDPLAG